MDDRFNILSGAVLDKPLDQCSIAELEELTSSYPYFSAAHFLLLKKKQEQGEDTSQLMQKAMLYYHDPVSFGHFINPQKTDERFLHETANTVTPLTPPFKREENKAELPETEDASMNEIPTIPSVSAPEPRVEKIAEKLVEETLSFEPYHTVDYFASQGIKPSKEEPKDTFGKQLKSFTEWLKTMKKLPDTPGNTAKAPDPAVEAMATRSVGDAVVVTEAMAEVWIKQGNKERAREIYRKLSLLDPSKTPYFAAKIDNLNAD